MAKEEAKATSTEEAKAETAVVADQVAETPSTEIQLENVRANIEALTSMNIAIDASLTDKESKLVATLEREAREAKYALVKERMLSFAEQFADVELEGSVTLTVSIGKHPESGQNAILSVKASGQRSSTGGGNGSPVGGSGATLNGVHYDSGSQALDAFKASNPEYAGKYEGSVNAHKVLGNLATAGKCEYTRDPVATA